MALKEKFPNIFAVCNNTKGSVAYFANRNWNLTFGRWLDERQQESEVTLLFLKANKVRYKNGGYPFNMTRMIAVLLDTNQIIWEA
ncbi:hypothetical protein C2845_PM12G11130 [Panicum miliaceum]|uniref:Uncharacterized protein n=1 Tax=Panicum miliaceum TaxID=4540 RepID=A0A3L6QI96_PANMI|nr:hypothetical protein C2845_PM12G11130 [Panicum miliaceum]